MTMEASFRIGCDVKLADNCRKTETIERVQGPNERMPEGGIVPPGWVQTKAGMVCPECVAVTP